MPRLHRYADNLGRFPGEDVAARVVAALRRWLDDQLRVETYFTVIRNAQAAGAEHDNGFRARLLRRVQQYRIFLLQPAGAPVEFHENI